MARTTIAELLASARARLSRPHPAEAAAAVAGGDALLVDIRSEYQRVADGVIPDTIWYPRNVLEWRVDPTSSAADPVLSRDFGRRLILFCDAGYASSLAAVSLHDLGFTQATDLDGGFQAWRAAGLPVAPLER